MLAIAAAGLVRAGGLDAPEAVGPFFNGVFPSEAPGGGGTLTTEIAFPSLSFSEPMYITAVPVTTRLAVVEKQGRIRTFENSPATSSTTTLLDLTGGRPAAGGQPAGYVYTNSDSGMTGVAFHPEFGLGQGKDYIYVTYKWRPNTGGNSGEHAFWRLSRFAVNPATLDADESSELIMIQQFDRQMWHDAGCVLFGQDGYLYFTHGDEGGANDQYNVSQQLDNRLFSGLFRIDVDETPGTTHAIRRQPLAVHPAQDPSWPDSFTQGYTIPNDNPFIVDPLANPTASILEEYWCFGLRNTFRFYQDPGTGLMWGGDVGQSAREEFNVLVAGGNYQWAYGEGSISGPKSEPVPIVGTEMPPLWDYDGSLGHCALGGAVYRGTEHPSLYGKHIFIDNVSQRVWAIETDGPTVETVTQITTLPGSGFFSGPTSVGADHNGELYITKLQGGRVYKFTVTGAVVAEPPTLLSATGVFSNLATLTPAAGVFPYAVNSPLWSDNAAKARWIILPNDGTHDTTGEKIGFHPNENWSFPAGTVLVKHFELPVDEDNPSAVQRLETRFFVMTGDGAPYGVTYKWLPDGSDAVLLTTGDSEDFTVMHSGGWASTQTWDFPSRGQCLECHTAEAGRVLGVRTHQLNGDNHYPRTGRTDNQLVTFADLGWFDGGYNPDFQKYYLRAHPIDDPAVPLEDRVRSYLDSNCSQCHRPGGVRAFFDARYTTPLHHQSLLYGGLFGSFLGAGEAVVVPGNAGLSVVPHRMGQLGLNQMPPIAKNVVHAEGVQVVTDWINALEARPGVVLSAMTGTSGAFPVTVSFTTPVTGLTLGDFEVGNGSATGLTPEADPLVYTLDVTPAAPGAVTVSLPANKAIDAGSFGNYPSNLLVVTVVDGSLVTFYDFEEGNGSVAGDVSGNANDATLVNMDDSDWTTGSCGYGLELDGVDDYLSLARPVSGDFTLALWIKTTQNFVVGDHAPATTPILYCDASGVADDFVLAGSQSGGGLNRATFFTGNPQTNIHGTSAINTGAWVHLAATREQATGTMRLYVNGVEEATVGGTNTGALDAAATLYVGRDDTLTDCFAGVIDEVRFYDAVLDPAEIALLQSCTEPDSPYLQYIKSALPGMTHLHDPLTDVEGDGLKNVQEWAFDLDVLGFDRNPVAAVRNGSGHFEITFPRLEGGGPTYTIFLSENLVQWIPAAGDLAETGRVDLPGPAEMVTYEYTGPMGAGGRLFGRVGVKE